MRTLRTLYLCFMLGVMCSCLTQGILFAAPPDNEQLQASCSSASGGRPVVGWCDLPLELQQMVYSKLSSRDKTRLLNADAELWRHLDRGTRAFIISRNLFPINDPHFAEIIARYTSLQVRNVTEDQMQRLLPFVAHMKELRIQGQQMSCEFADMVATGFPELCALTLARCKFVSHVAHALANGTLHQLMQLVFIRTYPKNRDLAALVRGNLLNLQLLRFDHCNIVDRGVEALTSGNLLHLRTLDLRNNQCTGKGIAKLVHTLPSIRTLILAGNRVNNAAALSIQEVMPEDATLDLSHNRINDRGIQAVIAHADHMILLLTDNPVTRRLMVCLRHQYREHQMIRL